MKGTSGRSYLVSKAYVNPMNAKCDLLLRVIESMRKEAYWDLILLRK